MNIAVNSNSGEKMAFNVPVTKYVLSIALLILLALVSYQMILSIAKASIGYNLIAVFERMPANDVELDDWLRVQPGVVPNTVQSYRDDRRLLVVFTMVRNFRGQPELPALDEKCRSLGYAGPNGVFGDCPLPIRYDPASRTIISVGGKDGKNSNL